MIITRKTLHIGKDVKYLSDWKDEFGGHMIDHYVGLGKYLVDKGCTGCGYTSFVLSNQENVILVSPRRSLIRNKFEQEDENVNGYKYFYYNREDVEENDPLKVCRYFDTKGNSEWLLREYLEGCSEHNQPIKLMVTYDSFTNLASLLEYIQLNISQTFKIYIDESHCIVKDAHMKQRFGKQTLTAFLKRLFTYDNLVFISATPIKKYLERLNAFKQNTVYYHTLDWESKVQIEYKTTGCRSSTHAFDMIYSYYEKNTDPSGTHVFDARHYGNGQSFYSYGAVIFLNSVSDIVKILSKYICKKGLINAADVTLICSPDKRNEKLLEKSGTGVTIRKSPPRRGAMHTTWTFVTKCAFEGNDFYNETASTFIIANYNVASLSLDIGSDIPQIAGRLRLESNIFRNILHIFYTSNTCTVDINEYNATRQKKKTDSYQVISDFSNISPAGRTQQLKMIDSYIENHPDAYYISTINGVPEIDDILMIEEEMCCDVLTGNVHIYTRAQANSVLLQQQQYSDITMNLLTQLTDVTSDTTDKTTSLRLRMCCAAFNAYVDLQQEFYDMLNKNGFSYLAYYLTSLPPDRMAANGYDTWKMDKEIANVYTSNACDIRSLVQSSFIPGQVYSKKGVKTIIQGIYDANGISRAAKATDLDGLKIQYKGAKDANGNKGIRIL